MKTDHGNRGAQRIQPLGIAAANLKAAVMYEELGKAMVRINTRIEQRDQSKEFRCEIDSAVMLAAELTARLAAVGAALEIETPDYSQG